MSEIAVAGFRARSVMPVAAHAGTLRSSLTAEVLHGPEALSTLAVEWSRIAERQAGTLLFQLQPMLDIWARHFRRSSSLATIVVRERDKAVLVWPLLVARRFPLSIVCSAGAPIGQYDEVLLHPDADGRAAIAAALGALRSVVRPDVVSLERVRADGPLRRVLPETFCIGNREAAPFVDLADGLDAALAHRKCSVAKTQRKRVKRFAKEGAVSVSLASTPEEAEAWLEEALALKREWLRSTGRLSRAFMQAATGNCLADLARTLSAHGSSPRMIVARLGLNGETAAIEAGFLHRDSFHLYLRAFAPKHAHLGPGNILTERMLEWCAENGVKRYDMLAPGSRNKSEWQTGEVEVADFILPLTARGRLYAATVPNVVGPALRDAFYALPERIRAPIAGMALRL